VPQKARWLMFSTKKKGVEESVVTIPANAGAPIPKLYLYSGSGDYQVNVFASESADRDARTYNFVIGTEVKNEDRRDTSYLLPSFSLQSDSSEIVEAASQASASAYSDREKALALHDWIAKELAYDFDGYNSNTYADRPFDALSVLKSKVTVCEGYSNLYAALLRAVGIRAKVVYGKRFVDGVPADKSYEQICKSEFSRLNDHAWNEIYIDNRWVMVDLTRDGGYSTDNTTAGFKHTPGNYKYFDLSPGDFSGQYVKCSEPAR